MSVRSDARLLEVGSASAAANLSFGAVGGPSDESPTSAPASRPDSGSGGPGRAARRSGLPAEILAALVPDWLVAVFATRLAAGPETCS